MNFFKQSFFVFLSSLLLISCTGGLTETLHDKDEQSDIVRFNVEKDNIYFFGLTPDKKIAVFGEKYHYLLEEQNSKDKQLIAQLMKLPFKQHIYSQIGIIESIKETPSEIVTSLYLVLDISQLNKKNQQIASKLGFKDKSYKRGLSTMVNQYKDKIDLAKLDKEKKIWSREVPLVGQRYLPKTGVNYMAKHSYSFNETVEIHTYIEYIPASKKPSTSTILLTPFAALADVATGILAVPAYIGLRAACIGQSDGFICK
ncbi:hypothetical protein [Pasteurella canis]|uniref:Lipoprotein n=1 Tax=Pasteurella canis TaxID=753 RepID=A0ABQ4VIY2_9PAST|nr:hypothetical protein [Pasteurella canis]UEC24085.1 hypothetical protein K7G93_000861 [Pasteurella canis]GJH42639.1 hypothetical protein PA42_08130 [Pasteurella canis]